MRPVHASAAAALAKGRGFTYLGLLFAIVVMGLALGATGQLWGAAQQRAKEDELLFVGAQFRRAIGQYAAAGGGYPHALEDLVKDPRVPGVRRFLRKIYRDPVTGRSEWGLVKGVGEAIVGVHSLSEAEPLKKANFAAADRRFEGSTRYSDWVFTPVGAAAAIRPTGPDPATMTQPQPGTVNPAPATTVPGKQP